MPTIESALMDVLQLISRKLDMILEEIKKHPEPKEKEKCWCECWSYPETVNLKDSGGRMFKPKFCPECGRKL